MARKKSETTWLRYAKEDDPIYKEGWEASIVPQSNSGSKKPSKVTPPKPSQQKDLREGGQAGAQIVAATPLPQKPRKHIANRSATSGRDD